jgi:hypothetical protein
MPPFSAKGATHTRLGRTPRDRRHHHDEGQRPDLSAAVPRATPANPELLQLSNRKVHRITAKYVYGRSATGTELVTNFPTNPPPENVPFNTLFLIVPWNVSPAKSLVKLTRTDPFFPSLQVPSPMSNPTSLNSRTAEQVLSSKSRIWISPALGVPPGRALVSYHAPVNR